MSVVLVVPCYNEAERLDPRLVRELLDASDVDLLFVDDGSTDATAALLSGLADDLPRVRVLTLDRNSGKAEAVRRGLLAALDAGATYTGYADADFATPPAELARLVRIAVDGEHPVVLGSRVALLGHRIDRKPSRHYLGRVFATCSSLVLGLVVYDTQCGAKVFRDTPALRSALAERFIGRWCFDVELIGRLAAPDGPQGFLEVPLHEWRDVRGSKLGLGASFRSTLELLAVRRALRRYRSRISSPVAR